MGNSTGSNKNRKWMSKDGISKMILPDDVDAYLNNGWHFGHDTDNQKEEHKKFYTNGEITYCIKEGEQIPDGFVPGMANKRPGGFSKYQYKWYTNGVDQKRISLLKGDEIPEGYYPGQADWMKEKSRNAAKGKKRTEEQIKNLKEGAKKAWALKLERGTFNTSEPEEKLYKELCEKYGVDGVKRQYNEDPRYPWHCDFYIPSEDLFIEVNKFPTHYKEPFDKNNEEHIKLLEHCKTNPSNWVERQLVYCWAGIDVKKRETAIKNKLNFLEIY